VDESAMEGDYTNSLLQDVFIGVVKSVLHKVAQPAPEGVEHPKDALR